MKSTLLARRCLFLLLCAGVVLPSTASADQPRDWVLRSRPEGLVLNTDLVFPGIGTSLEYRKNIYGFANQLLLRGEFLAIWPLSEALIDVDLRILAFTLGFTGGVRDTYRNIDMSEETDLSRKRRYEMENAGELNNALWGWAELRLRLSLPMNEYLVIDHITSFRKEGRPDRTFDWRSGIVHDGDLFKSTTWMIFKHRRVGGLAPVFQVLRADLDGRTQHFLNYGFAAITRPGFFRRNDIFLLEMIFNLGPGFGGDDATGYFGFQSLDAPFVIRTGYRVVWDIPSTEVDEGRVPLNQLIEAELGGQQPGPRP